MDRTDAGPFLRIHVSGTLNEALVPEDLAGYGDGRPVRLDLEKISRITSFGVRQWVRGLTGLRERSEGLIFERCSYACVSQLNLIAGFSADALIVSVMAPLRCTKCGHETNVAVDVTQGAPGDLEQPCSKCGAKAELEEDPDSYFAFANNRPLANGREVLYAKLQATDREAQAAKEAAEKLAAETAALEAKREAQKLREEAMLREAGRRPRTDMAAVTLRAMQSTRPGTTAPRPETPVERPAPAPPTPPLAAVSESWAQPQDDFDAFSSTSSEPMDAAELVELSSADVVEDLVQTESQPAPRSGSQPRSRPRTLDVNALMGPEPPQPARRPTVPPPAPAEAFEFAPQSWLARHYLLFVTFFGGVMFGYILSKF